MNFNPLAPDYHDWVQDLDEARLAARGHGMSILIVFDKSNSSEDSRRLAQRFQRPRLPQAVSTASMPWSTSTLSDTADAKENIEECRSQPPLLRAVPRERVSQHADDRRGGQRDRIPGRLSEGGMDGYHPTREHQGDDEGRGRHAAHRGDRVRGRARPTSSGCSSSGSRWATEIRKAIGKDQVRCPPVRKRTRPSASCWTCWRSTTWPASTSRRSPSGRRCCRPRCGTARWPSPAAIAAIGWPGWPVACRKGQREATEGSHGPGGGQVRRVEEGEGGTDLHRSQLGNLLPDEHDEAALRREQLYQEAAKKCDEALALDPPGHLGETLRYVHQGSWTRSKGSPAWGRASASPKADSS